MSIGSHRLSASILFRLSLLAGAFLLLVAITAGPARAAEEPFTIEFDQSSIEAGFLGDLDLEALSGPSTIEGTVDENGNVKIPKGQFELPVLDVSTIAQSLAGIEIPVEIEGFMGVEQAATGTFDRDTGQLEINTKAGLWVSINIQQLLGSLGGLGIDLPPEIGAITGLLGQNLTCGFSPMDVTFTTESTSLGEGQRFTRGLEGPGALTGEWSQLGPFAGKTKVFGILDACSLIRSQLPGLISGLAGGIGGGELLAGLDLAGLLEGLDELDLGPSGLTISRTTDESVTPPSNAKLKMAVVRTGKRSSPRLGTSYRVTVRNAGEAPASKARVCATAARGAVRGARCVALGTIAPGKAKRASFRLKVAPGARRSAYKVAFRIRASGGISSVRTTWLTRGPR